MTSACFFSGGKKVYMKEKEPGKQEEQSTVTIKNERIVNSLTQLEKKQQMGRTRRSHRGKPLLRRQKETLEEEARMQLSRT